MSSVRGNPDREPRVVSGASQGTDRGDASLRPETLAEYIGQAAVKEKLAIFIEAARRRSEPLDHVLFYGPPGLGKTTLAHIIAREMGAGIEVTSGPAIEQPGDVAAILTGQEDGGVLFIDEIHRLNKVIEEKLYPAMEEFRLDLVIGQGPGARILKLELPRFTLIGATTRAGSLTSPLRHRFGIICHLDYYVPEELLQIVERSARILGIPLEKNGGLEIARRSRGTPRIANRLLRRVRDYAQVKGEGVITERIANEALGMLGVDRQGLDEMDRKLLNLVIEKFAGGPVGIETLSAAISEERDTIEDVVEPFLLQIGFLERTPRGRKATVAAYKHLGTPFPATGTGDQGALFGSPNEE